MASCKCKMCGGQINYESNQVTATCEFCETEQTIVCTDDTKNSNLHNRAISLRLANEFDKALATYESILIDCPNDAEAHWGICLCRYGIEYVDDPKTKKKIPTCHRTAYNSIFDDIDYKEAIANCDVVAKRLYQSEAEAIDKIQKTILSISQKEEPYDIFICYKESDEMGNRTKDSVIAQEIYESLSEKGYKVFFARITLESKLGTQYEPIIFAALQSSKVMLAIGSKVEYYNAPWVKNEWSKFLSFMKEQRGKYLIPCYKDMEAYDMPSEFLSLQAQNIDKLGFLQDLIRGIDKIFGRKEKEVVLENQTNVSNNHYLNLLKRAHLCIEDQEYNKAALLVEDVLNENAECAEAYIALILIENQLTKEDDLMNLNTPLDQNKNFIKALRFANEDYNKKLVSYNEQIKNNIETREKQKIYSNAKALMMQKNYSYAINHLNRIINFKDSKDLIEECKYQINLDIYNQASELYVQQKYDLAIKEFKKILDFKDSKLLVEKCNNEIKSYTYSFAKELYDEGKYELAIKYFNTIIDYKDSKLFIEKSERNIEKNRCEGIYKVAISKIKSVFNSESNYIDETTFNDGINLLKQIIDYKDSKELIDKYQNDLVDLEKKLIEKREEQRLAEKRLAQLKKEKEEKERQERINREKIRKDKFKRFLKFFIPAVLLFTIILIIMFTLIIPSVKYNKAMEMINNGDYNGASEILDEIESFKDVDSQVVLLAARTSFEEFNYEIGIKFACKAGAEINISYDPDGGTADRLNYVVSNDNYIFNNCIKKGYYFNGWEIVDYNFYEDNYKIDLSLKAVYSLYTYGIILDFNNGEEVDYTRNFNVTSEDISIPNPVRTGYTFVGWLLKGETDPVTNLVIETGSINSREYVAQWKPNTYTITYDWNNGKNYSTLQEVIYYCDFNITIPEREGYKFLCWLDENGDYFGLEYYDLTKDIKLIAQWEIIEYNISYELNGGVNHDDNPLQYNYESNTIKLNYPTKLGYEFIGWTSTEDDIPILDITIPTNSVNDKSYIANWKVKTYTITYNVNGGDELTNNKQSVVYNSSYTLITPTRPGYRFAGWYLNGRLFENGVWNNVSDCELFAKWIVIYYSIDYELNGGVNHNDNPVEYTYDSNDIIFASPTKVGYTFLGWTSVDQTTPTIDLVLPHNNTKDRKITAHWKAKTYEITYDVNGGDELTNNKQSVVYDSYYTLITPTRTGYTFAGWYLNDNLVENGIWEVDHNSTLIAKWDIINYSITYDLNGAVNHVNNPTSFSFETNDIILLDPSKKGYTFIGWTTNEITIPTKNVVIEKGTTTNVTFIANFIANIYNVTFDVNSGNELLFNELEVVYDNYYELPKPEKIGYEFMGWYNDNELLVSDGLWKIDSDVNLVAKWDIINYNITYDLNGGRHSSYNPAKYNYEYQDIIINNPTKTGYTFIGWSVNSSEELVLDYVIKQYTNGDLLFTAKWKVNEYKLTLDVNGGNELDKCEFNINYDSIYTLPDVIRTGYTFNGWYNGKNKVESGTWKFSEDITLTAKWDVIYFNINYELDGGENNENPLTYTYDDETIVLKDAYKKGHTFIGWVTDSIFAPTKALEIPHNSLGNFSFEAVFEANIYYITFDTNGGEELEEIEVLYGDYVELPTPSNGNYPFAGWYYDGSKVMNGEWDIEGNVTLVAKWSGIPYTENGQTYVNLGRYPQTVVTDSNIISNLNNIATTNSLGYIEYLGKEYKKVRATPQGDKKFINGILINDNSIYYFKVEPIKWRVLQETDGTYKLLSEYILDNMDYFNRQYTSSRTVDGSTVYNNNYMYSDVRAWLNGLDGSSYNVSDYTGKGFLDIAFTNEEKLFINTTLVDNSASTTNNSSNSYTCSNTNDKVYLLSYKDMLNTSYGFSSSDSNYDEARRATVSDYARSKGCYIYTSYSYYGKGVWYLRSPNYDSTSYASGVNGYGCITDCFYFDYSRYGVRPALEITIK